MGARSLSATSGRIALALGLLACFAAAQPGPKPGEKPISPEMQRLASFVGEWNVEFEARAAPDERFTSYRTTSSITPLLNGAFIQERLSQPVPKGLPIELIGILGYDRFRKVYRFAWLDDTYALFDVDEGVWGAEDLVVTNIRSGTTLRFGSREFHGRMTWRPMGAETLMVESSASQDGGKTWFVQARGQYIRRR